MAISDIKDAIDIISLIISKWKKRTTIIIIEVLLILFHFIAVLNHCIDLDKNGTNIFKNQNYLKNISIIFFVLYIVILLIWVITTHIKKIKNDAIGIIFAIETENNKQRKRLSSSFYEQVVDITRKCSSRSIEIRFLDEYYSKRLKSDKNFVKKLVRRLNANIILYGKIEERKDKGKNLYSIDFDAIIRHKTIPQYISNKIGKEMNYILPSNVNFEVDNELSSFIITSEIIGEAVTFILGISFAYSGIYDEALEIHKNCLKLSSLALSQNNKNELARRINQGAKYYVVREANILSQKYREEGNLNRSINYVEYALSINPDDYDALLEKSINSFLIGNINESMSVLKKCSNNNHDYTWAYNKAFLHTFEAEFDDAYKLYRMLADKPAVINAANQCEIFIINYLEKNPDKYQLFYALGMIYYKIKQDYVLALDAFDMFIINSNRHNNEYKDTVKYVTIMKNSCEKKIK